MNTQIKNLDLNKIIAVDIETVRGVENFDEKHPFYDVWAWKQRDKKTNEIPEANVVIQNYINESALSPEWGKIVCISVGYILNGKIITKSFTGEEKDILRDFVATVKKSGRIMALHNAVFDVPYIRKRYFINGLPYSDFYSFTDSGVKPWDLEKYIVDTMVSYRGAGFANTSLEELAMVFNIPSPKGDMHGNEVGDYFYSGRIKDIAKYCESDVATVLNILLRWRGEVILEVESKTDVEIKVEGDIFQRLYQTKDFSEEIKSELVLHLKSIKATEEDLENAKGLLLANYLQKSDKSVERKRKEQEVINFINTIK